MRFRKILQTAYDYWTDPENSIFNDYIDALLGLFPLVVMPVISVVSLFCINEVGFWNYTFPVISICLAGAYDTYGRYRPHASKNIKLGIRVAIDFVVPISAACLQAEVPGIRAIPLVILLFCGLSFAFEALIRVRTAIETSAWYRRGDDVIV